MWSLLLASLLSAGPLEIDVKPLGGEVVSGTFVDLTSEKLTIETADGPRSFLFRDLTNAAPRAAAVPSPLKPAAWVRLVDGSTIPAESYEVARGKALVRPLGGEPLEFSTHAVHSVLFKDLSLSADLQRQWDEIEAKAREGDTIVISKESKVPVDGEDEGAVDTVVSLNSLDGLISDVTADVVQFKTDDTVYDVRRQRVAGLLYFHARGRELPDPICRIATADGSIWSVKSVQLRDETLEVTASSGVNVAVPLGNLKKLDFSVGNTIYLSDVQPDLVEWASYFGAPATGALLSKLYQPRMDKGFDAESLRLFDESGFDGDPHKKVKEFSKGIALHSRTLLAYRLPPKFKRFVAKAGIDNSVREQGHVRLIIRGDGKTLLDEAVSGKDPHPLDIDLDIAEVRRLTILVDFGEQLDMSDYLNLCDARITK